MIAEFNDLNSVKKLFAEQGSEIAAIIVEPIVGNMGVLIPESGFLQGLRDLCDGKKTLLIFDEVMTGFGRTGALFACQRAGIQPDLMALSKGLTGGFLPMGGTLASERLYQGFISDTPAHTFFHGHSFTANPLGCAAALASLDLLQSNPPRYQDFESRHRPLLEQLSRFPQVQRPRCAGTMAAFDLAIGEPSYLNPVGKQLQRLCLEQGVYLRPLGDVVYLLPPLSISDPQLQRCYGAIEQAIGTLSAA